MPPHDVHPAVAEAREISAEMRLVTRALKAAHGEHGNSDHLTAGVAGRAAASHAADLEVLRGRLVSLDSDPSARSAVIAALEERARVLRMAAQARVEERRLIELRGQADAIVAGAAASGRALTASERLRITKLRAEAERSHTPDWQDGITSAARRDGVLDALGASRIRDAKRELDDGLLLTEQMRGIIAEALPALRRGDPVLLVGETGGAKTALAEHLSRNGVRREPELVSGYGDITSAQLIGSHELRADGGATTSVFVPGPLLRAMTEGRPVILDEINAMPAEFLKRLNRILQLRPGDELGVQEDLGRRVRVAPGFAILATANEQTPHRYRGLERLSAELVNRFGANGYRVHYPDSGRPFEEFPVENGLIAAAAVADDHGELPSGISVDALARVARAAFISQQVFAGAHGPGFGDYVGTEQEIDGRPGLEESVLAPRTLVAILQKVSRSAGAVSLDLALSRFIESIMHPGDRRVLALILDGQGFRLP
ncbi:MAG: AAA family ATPase [Leucobacter sp.]